MQVESGSDAEAPSGGAPHTSADESSWSDHHRWWLWGGLAVAVIGGSVTAYLALSAPNTVVLHDGTLGSLRR
jgi:hypothetical protein